MLKLGTHHYVNRYAAEEAYGASFLEAWREGRVAVGPPAVKPHQRLQADREGRYWIIEDQSTVDPEKD